MTEDKKESDSNTHIKIMVNSFLPSMTMIVSRDVFEHFGGKYSSDQDIFKGVWRPGTFSKSDDRVKP